MPGISLPKGGGAIKSIGEKFQSNPITGTASYEVPIKLSPGRSDFGPKLSLRYDSGNGNSAFGLGWDLNLPSISRKTQRGIPKYEDDIESDTFLLAGSEDLVPLLVKQGNAWVPYKKTDGAYSITRYRPRIEGLFARIERWHHPVTGRSHWRVTSKDNTTSIYGQTESACIKHPYHPERIFQWLLEKTYDDKGNCLVYEFKEEDMENVPQTLFEQHRFKAYARATSNTYLKRVRYSNTIPVDRLSGELNADNKWLFELVLDYGEHGNDLPTYSETNKWLCRKDPQSSYRQGFEVRTFRLCKRLLMFHHFEELGTVPYLVASTDLDHEETPAASFLKKVQYWSYQEGKDPAPFPPIGFSYSQRTIGDPKTLEIGLENSNDLAVDFNKISWTDLNNEGIPGLLYCDQRSWWFKENRTITTPSFRPFTKVAETPSIYSSNTVTSELSDFDGDGIDELVIRSKGFSGFFEKENDRWANFRTFESNPAINWQDPNLRMIDLTGDGLADILITEDRCFTWYAGKGRAGYDRAQKIQNEIDESKGPSLVFKDGIQSIFLADMCGDGLTDLVRIRNGSICYWPNLGYGRFGAKVEMDNAPVFDFPDSFNYKRIRLADIDGAGTTDLVYIYKDKIVYWINESGNGFSTAVTLVTDLQFDNLSDVQVTDLFGKGTSALVISNTSPGIKKKLLTIDLMQDGKPYLLKEVNNNMGALTRFYYCSSTKFYLEAEKKGTPWITKLPFPVHVLEKTEIIDEIENNRFATHYAYHHGYYDGVEREFRGFGLVEQWDTETYEEHLKWEGDKIEEELYVPPVYTKTWFHTGSCSKTDFILEHYQKEYYRNDLGAWKLLLASVPEDLETNEFAAAARTLKGSMLRQEIYALDGPEKELHPYVVTQSGYEVRRIQPKEINLYPVFDLIVAEKLTHHYERNPHDPRIAHELTLETDEFGNIIRSAAIAYPRRLPAFEEQSRHSIVINENSFNNTSNNESYYKLGIGYETKEYELTGVGFNQNKFELEEIGRAFFAAREIPYEAEADQNQLQKRLLGNQQITFYSEDLKTELALGEIAFHTIPYRSLQKVFTAGLLEKAYAGKVTEKILLAAGYLFRDDHWWVPSGRIEVDPYQFYQPVKSIDAVGNMSLAEYDVHRLFAVKTINALGIATTAEFDYRVLQAVKVTDSNLNFSQVEFDVRGSVVATAVAGKNGEGDLLESPTIKTEYELFNWVNNSMPNYSKTQARERHKDTDTPWQVFYIYSNGAGQEILTKVQAEDGDAFYRDDSGSLAKDDTGNLKKRLTTDRWIGNGRVVLNNKGKPIKNYEPYFSYTPDYEAEAEIREYGVTPISRYDPMERVIRMDMPDGTFGKVDFDPWQTTNWDANDLVLESEWYKNAGSPDPRSSAPTDPLGRAAWLAAQHANTTHQVLMDYLGRDIILIEDNGSDGKYETKVVLDIEGNQQKVIDPKGRVLATNLYDMAGRQTYSWSADAGERWILYSQFVDEAEEDIPLPMYTWDSRGFERRIVFDALQRPHQEWRRDNEGKEKLVEWIVFGETLPGAVDKNLVGQAWLKFDQAGILLNELLDFKGNQISAYRQFAKEFKEVIDWSTLALVAVDELEKALAPYLEPEQFRSSSSVDALNRPIRTTHADGSMVMPTFNKANFLAQIKAQIKGKSKQTEFVQDIRYDEKGQRTAIYYGNGTKTNYEYDRMNFRLTRLFTVRQSDNSILQNLYYTYDAVGNITEIRDEAQQTVFFKNAQVEPSGKYEYDALYRLKVATGRELAGLYQTGSKDIPIQTIQQSSDTHALRRYTQSYEYDALGNILVMKHQAANGNWTRYYDYKDNSNHLLETRPKADAVVTKDLYVHDVHGNMIQMPHLISIQWDAYDQMKQVDLGGGGKAWYVYDGGGQRVRKVIERNGGKIQERLYLGEVEIYRERQNGTLELERESLHIFDDKNRIAQVDTLIVEDKQSVTYGQSLIRYQYSNHLGSATLELDERAAMISYEEYHPFGTSAYRCGKNETEVSLKRYRYSMKERDEETSLYYYGARHLIPWLGRFASADKFRSDNISSQTLNYYSYVLNSPINYIDPTGNFACMPYFAHHETLCVPDDDFGNLPKGKPETRQNTPKIDEPKTDPTPEKETPETEPTPGAFSEVPGSYLPYSLFHNDYYTTDYSNEFWASLGKDAAFFVGGGSKGIINAATNFALPLLDALDTGVTAGLSFIGFSQTEIDAVYALPMVGGLKLAKVVKSTQALRQSTRAAKYLRSGYKLRQSSTIVSSTTKGTMAHSKAIGNVMEQALSMTGPKTAINVGGRTRYPDRLVGGFLEESKNTRHLNLTFQLRDYLNYSLFNDLQMILYTRHGTTFSKPLQKLIDNGTIIHGKVQGF